MELQLQHQSSPSSEYSGLISFRIDWLDLGAVQGTLCSWRRPGHIRHSINDTITFSPCLTSSFYQKDYHGSQRWRHFWRSHSKLWVVVQGLKFRLRHPRTVPLLPPLTLRLGAVPFELAGPPWSRRWSLLRKATIPGSGGYQEAGSGSLGSHLLRLPPPSGNVSVISAYLTWASACTPFASPSLPARVLNVRL